MARHRGHEARVWFVTAFVLCLFGGLLGRLCVIQGVHAGRYKALAADQHHARVRRAVRRGTIYDRQGRRLAVSVQAPSIFANPREIEDKEETARRLEELLGVDAELLFERLTNRVERVCLKRRLWESEARRLRESAVLRRLGDAVEVVDGAVYARPASIGDRGAAAAELAGLLRRDEKEVLADLEGARQFVWVKRNVTADERRRVLGARAPSGIGVVSEYRRSYPHGELAAQLLGFTNIDDQGLEGLELALNDTLAGEAGYVTFQRDAAGRYISAVGLPHKPALPGADVELALDAVIQSYAEEALRQAWELWAPKAAVAVVLDPRTGDVLAAASLPTFDPNRYAQYQPSALRGRARARYIVDWVEPGSIMKPFVLSAALAEGLVNERTVVFCENGVWLVGSRRFHDHHAYGNLTAAEVIIKSSNVGAAKIGTKVGARRLYRYLRRFGFGRSTDFDLPGENPGLLRPPSAWTSYTVPSLSIGQEICVNILQMALAYAAIANDGVLVRPRLVRRTLRRDGTWQERLVQPVWRVIPASVARRVRRVLLRTVEEGTGRRSRLELYSVGGKTGTAQKPEPGGGYSHTRVVCSFVAMAPIERPRLVVMVSVDEPTKRTAGRHFGGTVAAPVAGRIVNQALAYLGVAPDKPQVLARLGLAAGRQRVAR